MRSAPLASRVFLFALICGFAALGLFQLKNRFLPAELTAEFVPFGVPTGEKTTVGATAKDADATAALNAVFDKANAQLRRASKKRQEVRK